MADHVVASNEVGTAEFTLAAGVVDTVTFDDVDLTTVEVVKVSGDAVWYVAGDASNTPNPTVGGRNCWYLPTGSWVDTRQPASSGETVLKFISSGAPTLRVQRGY